MNKEERQSLIAFPVIVLIGLGMAWAGSQDGLAVAGVPVFAIAGVLAFAINWAVFVHAYLARTERYFDLTGSLTYISVVATSLLLAARLDPRALLLVAMVCIWAGRLGSFLFLRIRRDGKDARFDALKQSFARFLLTWTLQGLWVLLTVACALAAITTQATRPLGLLSLIGSLIWLAGFSIEVVADRQKREFRAVPENRGRFIQSGLWSWSRHPNYFGEITLWFGVALIALPVLSGWQYLTLISPLFVYILLTRISGIPLLEARAEKAWGDDPAYRAHRDRTPALLLRPPRSA